MPDPIPDLLLAIEDARAGRHAAAELRLRGVLSLEPDNPHALFLLGECALAGGRPAEAAALLAHALSLRPQHRDGRLALARALLADSRAADALQALAPLAGDTALAAAQTLRGTALNRLGRPAEALEAFGHALAANPADAEAHLNAGNAHVDLDDLDRAEACIRQALALQPGLPEAHASLGHVLAGLGRTQEAVAACAQATLLRPDFAEAHWNQGVALLLAGELRTGWEKYEWRKRRFPHSFVALPGPQWDGSQPLNGRTILVVAEQGFGDTLQFARYLPLLSRRGARVIVECPASMTRLLAAQPSIAAACARGRRPAYDYWVDQMSLPRLFGTVLGTIPGRAGYLTPDAARAARWDAALPQGLRVGLVWAGNPAHSNDRRRSMPVAALRPVIAAGRGALVSLQTGPRAPEAAQLFGLPDHAARLTDWAETAALVSVLDLVITVDTAVAHLAGALAIPTWLMLPHAPDWRWLLGCDDSPWYASLRLFRQARPGDWDGVAHRVADALAAAAHSDWTTGYTMAMPPLTWSVAPVTQAASSDAR